MNVRIWFQLRTAVSKCVYLQGLLSFFTLFQSVT